MNYYSAPFERSFKGFERIFMDFEPLFIGFERTFKAYGTILYHSVAKFLYGCLKLFTAVSVTFVLCVKTKRCEVLDDSAPF